MSEDVTPSPEPKKRTRKAAPKTKTVEVTRLPWKPAGFVGAPVLDEGTEIMAAKLTFSAAGEDVWVFTPMTFTEFGMLRDNDGNTHAWRSIAGYCDVSDLIPDVDALRKLV